jgi:transcriptional regulator with XRE-family HTH domain
LKLDSIVSEKGLTKSLFKALNTVQLKATDFAKKVGISKSAVSNWKADETIPNYIKVDVAKALDDPEFCAKTANNLLGTPTVSIDLDLIHDALAQFVHLLNTEKKKGVIKDQLEEVLVHASTDHKAKKIVIEACRQLSEEAGLETQIIALLRYRFDVTDKEMKEHEYKCKRNGHFS